MVEYVDEMTYNFLCDALEKESWVNETVFIDEKMDYVVSLNNGKSGETTLIIDIECPKDKKILIRGTQNGDVEKFRDAYTIRLTLMDSLKKELSRFTKIRITKVRTTEGDAPVRCFYVDISKTDDDHLYRPRKNILLQEGEHLFVYVIGENIGVKSPDIAIDKNHISFSIKADVFCRTKEHKKDILPAELRRHFEDSMRDNHELMKMLANLKNMYVKDIV